MLDESSTLPQELASSAALISQLKEHLPQRWLEIRAAPGGKTLLESFVGERPVEIASLQAPDPRREDPQARLIYPLMIEQQGHGGLDLAVRRKLEALKFRRNPLVLLQAIEHGQQGRITLNVVIAPYRDFILFGNHVGLPVVDSDTWAYVRVRIFPQPYRAVIERVYVEGFWVRDAEAWVEPLVKEAKRWLSDAGIPDARITVAAELSSALQQPEPPATSVTVYGGRRADGTRQSFTVSAAELEQLKAQARVAYDDTSGEWRYLIAGGKTRDGSD